MVKYPLPQHKCRHEFHAISQSNGYIRTWQMTAHFTSIRTLPQTLRPQASHASLRTTVFSPPLQVSMTAQTSQRPKGRNDVLSTLDSVIQALTLAKDTCGIPPAQIAFGFAVALLAVIGVLPPPTLQRGTSDLVYRGFHDQRTRLRRTWNILRGYMSNPRPRTEWEAVG